ncbi:MAG: L,D-transpeptidase family protein [Sphingomicrobium sp.]
MVYYRFLAAAALVASSPAAAQYWGPPEPIGVPMSVDQGIDFIYVDPQLQSATGQQQQQPDNWMLRSIGFEWPGSQRASAPSPLFIELSRGLQQYQTSWGRLPRVYVPAGAALKAGSDDGRVDVLRQRLGMPLGFGFDQRLTDTLREYQRVHGLKVSGTADSATIRSLNLGADHYLRRIALNVERARRLPEMGQFQRYVVVDSGSAEIYMYNHDRVADSMRAIVGAPDSKTPMMALLMRGAKVNPYWNVPQDMIADFTAKNVLKQGTSYLKNYHYEVLTGSGAGTVPIDPRNVDWEAVAAGRSSILVRQLPGPWNSMGEIKFETPNQYGIYMHDTPTKSLFANADRWISNGCVRLEDADRFTAWVFGGMPQSEAREKLVPVPSPVPVYMTYLTVEASRDGVTFRPDPYNFDDRATQRMFGPPQQMAASGAN